MGLKINTLKNGIKNILITGELEFEGELEKFFEILDENSNAEVHITFTDAFVINDKVVDKLIELQNSIKYKIYIVKPYLYSYMYKLGIRCQYLSKRLIEKDVSLNEKRSYPIELDKNQVIEFLININEQYGYDYTEYQIESIIRRIKISMIRANVYSFDEFKHLILENRSFFEQLFVDFSINTTEFFRDPEVFAIIKDKIFSYLDSYSHIRIWCAGCSTGEEPYSLAILLQEAGLLKKTQIYATDINPYVIEEAKNGLYSFENIEKGIRNYRKAGGKNNFTDYFDSKERCVKIKEKLKKNILFFQHSLLGKGIINEFQLIFCRNVFIYFNVSLQVKVLDYLNNSLSKDGFLVFGKSGGLLQNGGNNYFNKYDELNKIYNRKES